MVEKNVAYNRDNRSDEFADNDPLAQLARLVAQEDRPAHVAPPVAASPVGRREPEFNLEDELLREFAIYDAPRSEPISLDPANDVHSAVPANEFLQRVESVFARREPELEAAPVAQPAVAPVEQYAPAENEEYLIAEHAVPSNAYSDLRNDFSDDPASVAAVFDVNHRDVQPQFDEPLHQPAVAEPVYEEPVAHNVVNPEPAQQYVEPRYEEPVAQVHQDYAQPAPAEPAHQSNWEQMAETSGETAIDLASELEMSVADAPAPVQPVPPSVRRSSLEFSSLRLPLANFGATRPIPNAPRPAAPVAAEPLPVESAPVVDAPVQKLEAPASHIEPSIPAEQKLSAMDELIYDVAKYEISNKSVSAVSPVAHMEPVATAAPVMALAVEAAVKPASQQVRAEPSFEAPAAKPAPVADDFDAFKDEDFELALDDIDFDIDLSEIANIDVPEPAVNKPAAVSAPVAAAPVPPKPVVAAAPVAPVAPAPVAPRPQPVSAPVARQEAPRQMAAVAPVPESLDSLPFDPTQIGETEDAPETITEMEVPELPVAVFEPKPAPRRHEEDLDIDTELAALFAPAASGGLDRQRGAEGKSAAERQPQPTPDEVDEFERALEEDFRRSMQEAAETRANSSSAHPANIGEQVRYQDEGRSGGRRWFVPMAAAVGLVLVGGGTYALMFGGSSGVGSSGAPVIISADNEPTKVVPENPGGRVVPNQDKAVYDRVAGGTPSGPTQPALISTNEEPVDVVQRTLIPEQLPLEDEADQISGMSTPVGETEDPRLLSPEEQQAQNNSGGSNVGVSPRKVRTMIVKPDGTLVAQEVPEPTPAAPQAERAEELAAPQAAPSGEGASAVIATSRVPVTPPQPTQAQPQQAAPAPVATQTAAPMPASRPAPAPQPTATAANQTNVRPAPPSQPAQETAAAPTPATNASSAGGYYIQIASLPSQADAQKSYQNLSTKFASVIGGRGVDIKAAEIAGKGTFYRVRIPAGDKNEAAALCERFRSAGGSCLIAR